MLSEDEREAIERLKAQLNFWKKQNIKNSDCEIILNLITKLQKENVEKNKQIDLMAEYMEENMDEYQLDEIYAKQYNCNGMERNWIRGKEKEVKDIKQYFERKARDGRD